MGGLTLLQVLAFLVCVDKGARVLGRQLIHGQVTLKVLGCGWRFFTFFGAQTGTRKGDFVHVVNELRDLHQRELVNCQELKDQINQLQQQNGAEQQLHASELQQLRDEKFQQQQQYARELQQLQGH